MGVTYRYMGISYSLKDDKETLIFFMLCGVKGEVLQIDFADGSDREPSLSKRGKRSKAERAVTNLLF